MKTVVMSHTSAENALAASADLNALSGVVAVDVYGAQTTSHCGERLDLGVLVRSAGRSGGASFVSQHGE